MRTLTLMAFAATLVACAPQPGGGPVAPLPEDGPDQCMAAQHRHLIGKNRSEIPASPAGRVWRVTCTTCAMTMDYNPNRMNILYDEQTGIVRQVTCG